MKTILITGAAGFIGSHLSERLLERGDSVVGIDNFNDFYSPAMKRDNLSAAQQHPNFILREGDICEPDFVHDVFSETRPDVVVHLAARAGVRPSLQNPALYHQVNVIGSQNILDNCITRRPSHLVFASSSSVYGGSTEIPFTEDNPVTRPISPYAATKRMNELMGHVYHHVHGLKITFLRFFTVYGPRQRPDMAIHKFTRMIHEDQPIPMFGDGSTKRDYTYIDDIIDGVERAIDKPLEYEILNLGEHHTTSLSELIRLIAAASGKDPVINRKPLQPGDVLITYASIDKARQLLGYTPRFGMEEGIQRFVQWYRERLPALTEKNH